MYAEKTGNRPKRGLLDRVRRRRKENSGRLEEQSGKGGVLRRH